MSDGEFLDTVVDSKESVVSSQGSVRFEIDILAADRYRQEHISRRLPPEKRLRLAVLQGAVSAYMNYAFSRNPQERYQFRQANAWIMREDYEYPYSFERICEVLQFDPSYIRKGLIRYLQNGSRKRT